MAIFGVFVSEVSMTTNKRNAFASMLARRRIVLEWKSPKPPYVSVWLNDLMLFLKLEKIKYFSRGSNDTFHKIWDPLLLYFA